MISVNSSVIKNINYSSRRRVLDVWFVSGAHWRYHGVTSVQYRGMLAANSIGQYFNTYVRNNSDIRAEQLAYVDNLHETTHA